LKFRIKKEGEELELEVGVPATLDLKGNTELFFEHAVRMDLSGEGHVELRVPAFVIAKELKVEGNVKVEVERGEEPPKLRRPRVGSVQHKILEALPSEREGAVSAEEIASTAGVELKRVYPALSRMVRLGLLGKVRREGRTAYYRIDRVKVFRGET